MNGRLPWRKALLAAALLCIALALTGCGKKNEAYAPPESGKIAVLVGTTSEKVAEKQYPKAEILKFEGLSDAVTALKSGKADYVISSLSNCANYAKHNEELTVLPGNLTSDAASIAVNKEETALCEDISRLIEQYRADGTLAELVDKWINGSGTGYGAMEIPEGDGPELAIAISAEREPMCFVQDGEYMGLDVELARRIAYDLGRKAVFHDMKFAAMVPSVVSGKTPMAISNISDTPERRESVSFTPGYFDNPQVILTRKEIAEQLGGGAATLESLNGQPIGIRSGTVFDKLTEEVFPDSEGLYFSTNADLALALTQGKIAGFMADEPVCRLMLAENAKLAMLPDLIRKEDYAFAFAKTPEGEALRDKMNAYLERISGDGTRDALIARWLDGTEEEKTMPDAGAVKGPNGTVRMASDFGNAPFSYLRDNRYVGYEMELLTGFCEAEGYSLTISSADFSALIPGLVSGVYDVAAACITITEERAQSVAFSDPIYNGGVAMVVAAQQSAGAGAAVPPETARIGALTGTTCETAALELYPDAEVSSFNNQNDCMAALKAGQLDYASATDTDAINYARNDPAYQTYGTPLRATCCNIAVDKNQPELLSRIDALLTQYKADGTLDRVYANWIRPDGSDYVVETVPERTEGPVLRVATCAGFEPTGFYRNGILEGYDIELSKRLAYDLGMQVKFIDMDFSALIPALKTGKADVILSNMTETEERAQSVDFTQSYFDSDIVLVRYVTETAPEDKGFFESLAASFEKYFVREQRWRLIVSGIGVTLLISVCSALFGSAVGFGVCMMRRSHSSLLSGTARVYIRILQGTPIVVLLMILYYVVFNKTGLDGVTVAIIAFGLNYGAYTAEMLRTGIDAVDKGQVEAAAAIGFTPRKTFAKIVFPQAARHFLPVMKGEFISLVKMTSVVGYVAVQDLTKASDIIRSRTYEAFFPLIATAVIYFLLAWALSSLLSLVEVRIDPKRRKLKLPDDTAAQEGGDRA